MYVNSKQTWCLTYSSAVLLAGLQHWYRQRAGAGASCGQARKGARKLEGLVLQHLKSDYCALLVWSCRPFLSKAHKVNTMQTTCNTHNGTQNTTVTNLEDMDQLTYFVEGTAGSGC